MPVEQAQLRASSALTSSAATTTLHLSLLTSHYLGVTDADEAASTSGVSGGHKREAANAKAAVAAPKTAGKERETYACRTSAEQLDSVARVLRLVLHKRFHPSLSPTSSALQQSTEDECVSIALQAHYVQLAKAVRDGAISWAELTPMLGDAGIEKFALKDVSSPGDDAQPKLSILSLLSDQLGVPATAAVAPAAATTTTTNRTSSAKPGSQTSSRGRGSAGNGANRRSTSSNSSRRDSAPSTGQQILTDAENRFCQAYINGYLPPCEVVSVPTSAAAPKDSPSSPVFPSPSFPVFFLYHLAHEEEVVAALAARSSAELDAAGSETGNALTERERRRARASQAAALVTRAVWCTLRPVLRSYLHRVEATAIPSHLSVVWAVADPSLLEGLNSYTGEDAEDVASFFPCPSAVPASGVSASEVVERVEAASVERWVRLVPRSAIYLYDPATSSGPASAAVDVALAALQVDRVDRSRNGATAGTAKTGRQWGNADGGVKSTALTQRGNQGGAAATATAVAPSSSTHKASRTAGGAATTAAKGRGGNVRGDGVSASNAATAAKELLWHALADQRDVAAPVDMNAEPSAFPYCAADPTSLACYLYAGCECVADGAPHVPPARDPRAKAVTSFLSKAAAYQRAVFATIATGTSENMEAKSSLPVTAAVLKWVQEFLSSPTAKEEEQSANAQQSSFSSQGESKPLLSNVVPQTGVAAGGCGVDMVTLRGDVAKTSLMRTGLDTNKWPLPLWVVTAVPLATVPPLPLRTASGSLSVGNGGSGVKEASVSQLDFNALSTFTAWVSALKGVESVDDNVRVQQNFGVGALLQLVTRLGHLVEAYAAWTQQRVPHLADRSSRSPCSGIKKEEEKGNKVLGSVQLAHDSFTDGVFTVVNAVSALMAETSRALASQRVPQSLTAVCTTEEVDDEAQTPTSPGGATQAVTTPPSSGLFHRYKNPFAKLAAARCGDGGGGVVEVVMVPRAAPANSNGAVAERCAVKVADTRESADVVLPPYPQEVVSMVQQIVAKNAGHFEVNSPRGTDTISTALSSGGGGGAGGAMVESVMTGSSSPVSRHATMLNNTTTQSTGLLLRQQQQQQRRRQREQGGSVAAALRPYVHGVRIVKEVSKANLGRRPNTEAAVLLQEALESTLATRPNWKDVDHSLQCSGDTRGTADKAHMVKVNALELLQRYLASGRGSSSPPMQGGSSATARQFISANRGLTKESDSALSAANAASAAAQALTPRVYEHCLQQVLLHQLLKEAGLEPPLHGSDVDDNGAEDWTVTEQIRTETIVPSLVDFRERFGAHNVVVKAPTLDYHLSSTAAATATPPPSASHPPASLTGNAVTSTSARSGAVKESEEVHQTSAYAHNALNVNPTRRVTQLWMAGILLPTGSGIDNQKRKGEPLSSNFRRCRTRKWVDMVPRGGTITSMEMYAVWRSLLLAEVCKGGVTEANAEGALHAAEAGKSLPTLTPHFVYQLIDQYVQRHAEASTVLLGRVERVPSAPIELATVPTVPMRFSTHETLYPYGDALLEVWAGEAQRTCRYIKAAEVTAALHMGVRSPGTLSSPLHLSVRWDDGLLFSCSTTGAKQSSSVPLIDVRVTTSNLVLQRCAEVARLRLRRFPNTSSCATAAGTAAGHESGGQSAAYFPQGLLSEVCPLLFEERTTLYCVHDCPPLEESSTTEGAAAVGDAGTAVVEATIDISVEEAEESCEVDEVTGVVHRVYPSGTHLLQFPSGAMLARRPIAAESMAADTTAANAATHCPLSSTFAPPLAGQQWCETLVTSDGRCFVRRVCTPAQDTPPRTAADTTTERQPPRSATDMASGVFRRVVPRTKKDGLPPAFTHAEAIYDAVRHCHVRSRQDGLTVVEYGSVAETSVAATTATARVQQPSARTVARVVVFPDGTSITTLADRDVRQRVLSGRGAAVGGGSLPPAIALSSSSLCAMLEEVEAVESRLFGASEDVEAGEDDTDRAAAGAQPSVRWLVEAPTLPRFYLAPAEAEHNTAFSVVFGDGTMLQRHWLPAAASSPPPGDATRLQSSPRTSSSAAIAADDESFHLDATASTSDATASTWYNGGTAATVLLRPSTSAVRVLHQHAVATIEPADVLASTTRASPAAYAVGQGLPFFDFAYGGGMRLVDAARCVWEIRGLANPSGPNVFYPDYPRPYEELLRELVSAHYSPHRLPRAAEVTYACEQRRERLMYARQRSTGWCPPLARRLRELSEPYIRTTNLLRSDVLTPIEAAAAGVAEGVEFDLTGGTTLRTSSAHRAAAAVAAVRAIATIRPVCFGQLANSESIRYWCARDVIRAPSSTEAATASVAAFANEPHVLQRVVPSVAAGGVLRYTCNAPSYASAAEVMAVLSAGGRGDAGGDGSVLSQRLAEAQRLSLLCIGGLAPVLPSSSTRGSSPEFAVTYVSSLPPLAVLISHGCRWLPPSLQPPQQFSSAYSKSVVHAVAAQRDVAWIHDGTAAATGASAAGAAYVQYTTAHMEPGAPPAMLRMAVVRRELRRYEELAQLSRYHRVLAAQWPMEQPGTAHEEQVRLEMRCEELQRARRPLLTEEKTFFPSAVSKDSNTAGCRQQTASRLVI
ncbi:hypothetical protein ABB37_00231 [Leptomonas pyrrhocoris]|uniref:Uncharacterized protein n=1 Tax=Leptomonas pyrrhocoris TaxID=157538 RepID=A0A0N0VHS1_LEPPY|nr:hypothetical protein ABB37_00231 [Leptomonas pyrrhocoris]KPA85924.1 hypothetical protein ABB37_00231 [Leptomonas pyrrhocoris]|eukprot:XP_015664363.1 hypothetical protein ABB37_00231 [Leptomonas pyrrhocoris]